MEPGDVCAGLEAIQVPVCGPWEDLGPFQYTPELTAGPGADPDPSEVTIQGCQCQGQSCAAEQCPCLPRGENYANGRRLLQTYGDPTRIGNVGRFLNHSCRPNLVMLPVRSHSTVPRLALFAARRIQEGEELCYDYSGRSFNAEPGEESQSAGEEGGPGPRKRCLCGADVCSGYLPFDGSLYGGDARKSDPD
ncbi:PREDICTED: histone-lysine N-methyltransferase SETMAR [Nanorana parkeri]|uniref:histone-lysine N-methyltransferase SETMAR n=1 Tax=Nanorana parkeri TaxID=125878 RepID=UPI000853F3F6|nr:PREDICTED: histone-lysine N-methyltransferase SETMAR [Nanorana parkeri]